MNRSAQRVLATVAATVAAVILSGCTPTVTDEELFEQARGVYLDYRSAAAEVQLEIFDGEWVIDDYGDSPDACGTDGYAFSFGRSTPAGWKIDGTPSEAADRLAAWLDENGWSKITKRTYDDGITDVVVEAERPDAHVAHITVDISPGELYDSTTIYLDSTCEPGDWMAIYDLRTPGDPSSAEIEKLPAAEHPLAEPSFGYTKDGKRRLWPDDAN